MLQKKLNWVRGVLVAGTVCASMSLFAGEATVWRDSAGDVVTDGAGDCLHTIWWKQGDDPCGKKPVVQAAPVPAPAAPVVQATPEPVPATPAPAAPAAPVYEPFTLSSSAAFALSGSSLSPAGEAEIRAFADKLAGHDVSKITVEGYTDSSGSAAFNQVLSEKRANAVKDEMIKDGINGNIITTIGHGEDDPVASNATRAGRAANRRVKVTVEGREIVQ